MTDRQEPLIIPPPTREARRPSFGDKRGMEACFEDLPEDKLFHIYPQSEGPGGVSYIKGAPAEAFNATLVGEPRLGFPKYRYFSRDFKVFIDRKW